MLTKRKELRRIAGIVVAAGLSKRMGLFKPLMPYTHGSMIETTVTKLQQAGTDKIILVTGYRSAEIAERFLHAENVLLVKNEQYLYGDMLESVQLGLKEAVDCDAAYVMPGDMPAIAVETFLKVRHSMEQTGAKVVFPTVAGKKKHPPFIRNACFSTICKFRGEGGLRVILDKFSAETARVPVEDIGCTLDADTWKDYMRLLEYQKQRTILAMHEQVT
ncbi:nucleotidyltransferase family protein [Anaerosinus massiliensis]|uniref:nucleotidyltransferase family protein n=1 Tax=Massilibacillus massiliensis TaxID=1806837 RepID=UPI0018FE24DB|nr:nucleotidyltransferase family protein [Massilibacillus massiliensis]